VRQPVIILGPTAIGKTSVSIKLAKEIDAEIISSDSVQIYKFMDIGSAKPSLDEQRLIKHHLIDIKYPDEVFSSGEFVRYVEDIMKDINKKGKNVIIVGGGGFYIDSLVFGIDKIGKVDDKIRRFFDDICEELSPPYLYNFLKIVDRKWANSINERDCQRIKRGLSVYFDSKTELSSLFSKDKQKKGDRRFKIFVLYASKEFIDKQIEKRVDKMIEGGFIDEVKKLVDMGYGDSNAMKSIGYKEILSFLNKETDKETAVKLIKKNTKAYAKRQLTLFRSRFLDAVWIDVEKENALEVMLDFCKPSV